MNAGGDIVVFKLRFLSAGSLNYIILFRQAIKIQVDDTLKTKPCPCLKVDES